MENIETSLQNEEKVEYKTVLYTNIGNFDSPFSYEETLKKIKESDGVLELKRYSLGTKTVENEGEISEIMTKMEITVRLDTNVTNILCYEEFKVTEIKKTVTNNNLEDEHNTDSDK